MRLKNLLIAGILISSVCLFTQCKKGNIEPLSDDDSDRPAWAGGNTDENPHIRGNDDSGTPRGGEYGDLFVLLRDLNGVPELTQIGQEWYVQPIGDDGLPLELNEEGELVDASLATEVEFGRLNIVRSPESVLDHAFEEAMKPIKAPGAILSLDFCGRLTSTYPDAITGEIIVKTIDSPLENLSIYKYIMNYMFEPLDEGTNRLAFLGEPPYNWDPLAIAASAFAAGSDKSGTITLDEVVYINGFLDCVGLNPILNEHEYNMTMENKYYWNWGDCYGDGTYMYSYNRQHTYQNRYIQFQVWDNIYYPIDEYGNCEGPVYSILDFFEGVVDGEHRFTYEWQGVETHVKGFTIACDDAVQVLDFVHGDSNIRFLPDYTPPAVP